MRRSGWCVAAMVALLCATAMPAAAGGPGPGVTGNDTGGIIPWSRENQRFALDMARAHCAYYDKHARITSLRARYGEYIVFACRWYHDPSFARRVVRTRG